LLTLFLDFSAAACNSDCTVYGGIPYAPYTSTRYEVRITFVQKSWHISCLSITWLCDLGRYIYSLESAPVVTRNTGQLPVKCMISSEFLWRSQWQARDERTDRQTDCGSAIWNVVCYTEHLFVVQLFFLAQNTCPIWCWGAV